MEEENNTKINTFMSWTSHTTTQLTFIMRSVLYTCRKWSGIFGNTSLR